MYIYIYMYSCIVILFNNFLKTKVKLLMLVYILVNGENLYPVKFVFSAVYDI